jgi:hypothetical protein
VEEVEEWVDHHLREALGVAEDHLLPRRLFLQYFLLLRHHLLGPVGLLLVEVVEVGAAGYRLAQTLGLFLCRHLTVLLLFLLLLEVLLLLLLLLRRCLCP